MRENIQRVPAYQYYTALGQVLSRVCHEVPTVVNTLIDLIVRIFETYPHQTVWFLMPLNDVSFALLKLIFFASDMWQGDGSHLRISPPCSFSLIQRVV